MRILTSILAALIHLLVWLPIALLATPFGLLALAMLPAKREPVLVRVRSNSRSKI
jgi:hypothetical protein